MTPEPTDDSTNRNGASGVPNPPALHKAQSPSARQAALEAPRYSVDRFKRNGDWL
ncbi:hypothetical protein [Candidatus Phycosocius bacilliformis]|uniref:hypothetical protein n=1 Tax=Candidatus Phycosocius bacilliformis TaxID=1445552 RepID=UPI001788E45E|nr:hypothetical protein [Candidatus Phycosocius bacilliformis]